MKVLLDANALMMPAQFQIDLFDELRNLIGSFEPVVLSAVLHELEGLTQAKGRHGAAARMGLALAAHCTVTESRGLQSESVDAQVIEYAALTNCVVVTNDRRIRDALYARGISVISMRNQKKLEIMRR
ncbi:PIN domain-containing protein [Methanoregula sp.]|uniref:PIN domain-containing protein n=1 Tax=Methanoregula sp. TaxID=2052170 RepID=UPI003C221813